MGSLGDLPQGFLACCITGLQKFRQLCGNLLQERGFPDARIATEQYHGARYQPAAKYTIEFAKPRRVPQSRIVGQCAERGRFRSGGSAGRRCSNIYPAERVPGLAIRALTLPFHAMRTTFGTHKG